MTSSASATELRALFRVARRCRGASDTDRGREPACHATGNGRARRARPFAFADPERVRRILSRACLVEVETNRVIEKVGGGTPDETARMRFERYSPALKASGVVWNETALDQWLTSPAQFIPDNYMTFAGIPDARQRADLIAFLKEAANGQAPSAGRGEMMGGMTPNFTDLKTVGSGCCQFSRSKLGFKLQ